MNQFSVVVGITAKRLTIAQISRSIGLDGDPDSVEQTADRNGFKAAAGQRPPEVWTLTAKRGRTIEARVRSLLQDLPSDLPLKLKGLPHAKGWMSIAVMCFEKVATLRFSKDLIADVVTSGLGLEVKIFSPSDVEMNRTHQP